MAGGFFNGFCGGGLEEYSPSLRIDVSLGYPRVVKQKVAGVGVGAKAVLDFHRACAFGPVMRPMP